MQLIYRGVQHDRQTAALKVRETGVSGKYRGQVWNQQALAETPAAAPLHHLKYRGAAYTIGEIETAKTRQPIEAVVPSGTVLSNLLPQVSRLHKANLQHNIEHRLEVAKAQGNSNLIAMLEREFQEVMS
ncbi:DUF4278 domain-containing protein [filamentous cyanobacterium LEGE 11480]|uniref:DUF4278 domain-containing protein n=1 Tax=Romeriopsis navalis LEGE 11480 TaxID=2777977 RepID=A0A928VTK9_9CYAN|nr:DUF4278 domain-containing protein [Romeriopsis navalis]MBE9032335.1 DUF4278 domain-containing protein [Romeriopsis navalis LEGE 11480]